VTGANKGIGFALVRRLLNEFNDTFIYLGSRDISRGEAAVKSLIEESDSWTARLKLIHIEVDSASSGTLFCFLKVILFF
jgi:NAD(P)-dependent dehydrogenase (short-subunit alcohol dehydrogenase family)